MTDKHKTKIKIEYENDSFEWSRRLTIEEFNRIALELDSILREYSTD